MHAPAPSCWVGLGIFRHRSGSQCGSSLRPHAPLSLWLGRLGFSRPTAKLPLSAKKIGPLEANFPRSRPASQSLRSSTSRYVSIFPPFPLRNIEAIGTSITDTQFLTSPSCSKNVRWKASWPQRGPQAAQQPPRPAVGRSVLQEACPGHRLQVEVRKFRQSSRPSKKLCFESKLTYPLFSPFGGSSHAKGIVLETVGVEAKQPNSVRCPR
jgi:hypothetical protein